jgi:beta propeller repeat protein
MKTNQKLHSATLFFLVVILLLTVITATASASISETHISNSGDICDIGGNKLVWFDYSGGGYTHLYDLLTKKDTILNLHPDTYVYAISGNKIVYEKDGNIYCYDLTTKKEIYVDYSNDIVSLDMSGNIIAWVNAGYIYYYDINTKKESSIVADASSVSVYSNKIIYDNDDGGRSNVFMYDISTKTKTQITKSGTASNPSIYGTKIVYQDSRKGNYDIYMYDISTKKETQITLNTEDQINSNIYGNTITWQDYRDEFIQIYAYDLITHQQVHTLEAFSDHLGPVLSENKIACVDFDDDDGLRLYSGIYVYTISYLPVAAFTASPTSGKHPLTVKFTDKSTDVYYYNWNFGDKSTSTVKNPTHKYTKVGKYTVKLTVKNAAGSSSKTMTITVK